MLRTKLAFVAIFALAADLVFCQEIRRLDHSSNVVTTAYNIPVVQTVFSPDARYLAVGGDQGIVTLWDIKNGPLFKWQNKGNQRPGAVTTFLGFNHSGSLLARATFYLPGGLRNKCELDLLNAETGSPVKTIASHEAWIFSICFSEEDKYLAYGTKDKLKIIAVSTGKKHREIKQKKQFLWPLGFLKENKLLFMSTPYKKVKGSLYIDSQWGKNKLKIVDIRSGRIAKTYTPQNYGDLIAIYYEQIGLDLSFLKAKIT